MITPKPADGYFNPRLREGGDNARFAYAVAATDISIHASAREATVIAVVLSLDLMISIHASAREATALITNFYI